MGSNMAEAHPVGFQWVMEAKSRGAKVIHIDPRFTRTSAVADTYVPIRAGTDIAFLGGVINYILTNDLDFREYVSAFTNAATLISDEYRDTEDLDGLFSGYDADSATYDRGSWQYQGASQVDEDTGDSTEHKEQTRPMQSGSGGAPLDALCVPYNIFQTGGVTQAALDYLQTPGFSHGNVDQTIAHADITLEGGEYGIQTPWSDRGVGLNFGGDYIKNSLKFDVDEAFETGDLAGQGGPTIGVTGKYDVREAFAEIQVPIISHSFIEELTLGAGYRYSDYKVANHHFNTDTYKVSLEFAPIHDIRARASYNRAVRAPNIVELFSAQSVGLAGTIDPCSGTTPSATLAQCQLTGVTAGQYGGINGNPAGQYNSFLGGNPALAPETADSYTAGLVLQPRFVPGLALTVDYFDIKVKKVIGTIGYNTIMTQCLSTGDPFFCSRIHRATGNGSLWLPVTDINNGGYITDLNDNIGGLRTKGIDVNGSYSRRLGGMGTLSLSMVGTYLMDLTTSPLAGISYDCKGFYGLQCGTPNPKWRHKARIGFTMPNGLGLSLQWRHFSSVKDDTLSSDPDLHVAPFARPFDEKLNAKNYFDLALSARLADRYNLRMGVNNLLDTDPPLSTSTADAPAGYGARTSPPFGNGNTFPQVYDSLGRYLFAGVTIDF